MPTRHPDAMRLDRDLTPLQLAAFMRVGTEEEDRCLKEIMRTLLHRGAQITQREAQSGVTIMHLLASQPAWCSVIHRIRFLLTILEKYRNGTGRMVPMAGLRFDPVLNAAPAAGGGGDVVSIAVHLLGMRDKRGRLPHHMAPAGDRRCMLQLHCRMLPPGLQDTPHPEAGVDVN